MDKKEMIIAGIVVVIAVVVAGIVFAPSDVAKHTTLDILNKGDFGENSTIYVKLTDDEKSALSGKTVHITLKDQKGKLVYNKTVKTHATGVALAKLNSVPAGEYTLNVTFDGDGNYSASSISHKVTVKGEVVEDVVDNSTLIQDTLDDTDSSQDTSYQQSSYTPSYSQSSSSQTSSSSSDSSADTYYDEDGNEMLPEYDEDGNQVAPF
ncbi:MAG: Ig-like domain-containing protein [Methanobrevibacter sp.]|uniref:Ig-like domain-containing protein n=1 Tax=Methanobrevibacter sp. TaxID=66852 RepID=UPI002E78C5CA|nr:Ig-like domain-containing protein [Methanobrevibacter sp.]MEE0935852.1 Ig-like domain-containing protein [Methanobrevibacter sp.]